jgi:hypothetical protein
LLTIMTERVSEQKNILIFQKYLLTVDFSITSLYLVNQSLCRGLEARLSRVQ